MGLCGKKPAEPVRWDCAREITKTEVESGTLPPGWYIYPDGYMWYGLRPGSGGMERSGSYHDPKELRQWLGVPVPEPRAASPAPEKPLSALDELVRQTVQAETPPLPSLERLLATGLNTEEEQTIQGDNAQRQQIPALEKAAETLISQKTISEASPPQQNRRRLNRSNQVKTRFSSGELARFRRRVEKSGLSQSEFLRQAALNGRIVIEEKEPMTVAIMDDLELIRAELGRQGGMLKMVIKPNQGQRELHPEEWEKLVQAIRYLEHTKERLGKLEDKLNGNRQT